jgi:F420-0:gamma-glutamyl ligase
VPPTIVCQDAETALEAFEKLGGDVVVVTQKIVSKAEGRLVKLADVQPSPIALAMAPGLAKDPRLVEVILAESRRVVRMDKGVLITETHHGWICANAGIDQSNVDADSVALLPEDSDRSARAVRGRRSKTGSRRWEVEQIAHLSRQIRAQRRFSAGKRGIARMLLTEV